MAIHPARPEDAPALVALRALVYPYLVHGVEGTTLPAYRGRGLARLAKLAALHRARDAGATDACTSNDEANAPMLAINGRLGYRPVATRWSCLRDLT